MNFLVLLFFALVFNQISFATELRMSRSQALRQGFKAQQTLKSSQAADPLPNSLPWPVQFIDSRHTIGNSMPEYQNYSNEAYYHEGTDLRLARAGKVTAPVDGFLQGDYYTYVTDPNTGEDQKFTKPITEGGESLYFEITIKTADNFLFEFHHINPESLPKAVYELVVQGGGNISRGELLGTAAIWPNTRFNERYDHIHYNLISPTGAYMNTEYYSQALVDASAPVIKNIFAIYKDKKIEVLNQTLTGLPTELIVSAIDLKGENIYPLPPSRVEAAWTLPASLPTSLPASSSSPSFQRQSIGWDFTQKLLTYLGVFPDIREVYARNLKLSDGRSFTTKGDYNNTVFLYRLKIPPTATSPITLTVQDSSGNKNILLLNVLLWSALPAP